MQRERRQSIFTLLRPDLESIGYALFLAINAAGVWGGVFPFLPLAFQTPKILFWFFLSQSLAFSASFALSCVGAYFLPGPTRRFSVKLASAPYFLGWCCLIAAIYLDGAALALVVAGGVLLGLGSAGFYMLWQRLFASQDADGGSRGLLVGTAWGAVLYYALHLIPQAVTAYLIPAAFLPLFGLVVTLRSRTINLDQPMFEDVPQDHPAVYAHALRGYWRSALCVGALGFCAGGAGAPAGADEAAPAAGGGARGAGGVSAAGPLLPAEATEAADLLAAQAQRARERYRLSAREAEVMELIARGHSVARIAEMLVVSENTIRTHSKRIYTKLDIHKKQELLDLLETL